MKLNRLLKKAHLLRCPHSSSLPGFAGCLLRRTPMYASFLGISVALYLNLFEQPVKKEFFRILLKIVWGPELYDSGPPISLKFFTPSL
jgi:hypothetical protein